MRQRNVSSLLAMLNGFATLSSISSLELNEIRRLGAVCAEGLAPVVVSCALLTVAWAAIAIGMRRT